MNFLNFLNFTRQKCARVSRSRAATSTANSCKPETTEGIAGQRRPSDVSSFSRHRLISHPATYAFLPADLCSSSIWSVASMTDVLDICRDGNFLGSAAKSAFAIPGSSVTETVNCSALWR